jgi:putative serine protease PepD
VSPRGVVVANYHVIADAREIEVVLPSDEAKISLESVRTYPANVLKTHECFDLAVLRIPTRTPVYLEFAEGDPRPGEPVHAIGNPEGLMVSVSGGVVSAVRTIREMGLEDMVDALAVECQHLSARSLGNYTLIQTDASINPGNSGGPLLNARQEIVGINTLMAGIGLNFAIHAKHAKELAGSYARE